VILPRFSTPPLIHNPTFRIELICMKFERKWLNLIANTFPVVKRHIYLSTCACIVGLISPTLASTQSTELAKMVNLPTPFSELPREQLLYAQPSPIEPLSRLSAELDNSNVEEESRTKFWIKREDSNSGLACGGNKIRKLEYVIPDALNKGATVLVTTGGLQSNHMRQVAAAGARYGLKVCLHEIVCCIPTDKCHRHIWSHETE
jgi:hypothetical protein